MEIWTQNCFPLMRNAFDNKSAIKRNRKMIQRIFFDIKFFFALFITFSRSLFHTICLFKALHFTKWNIIQKYTNELILWMRKEQLHKIFRQAYFVSILFQYFARSLFLSLILSNIWLMVFSKVLWWFFLTEHVTIYDDACQSRFYF